MVDFDQAMPAVPAVYMSEGKALVVEEVRGW